MARIFDYEMTNGDTVIVRDGERLYRIITGNVCDSLYMISTPETVEEDARAGMRSKFGRRGPAMIRAIEEAAAW